MTCFKDVRSHDNPQTANNENSTSDKVLNTDMVTVTADHPTAAPLPIKDADLHSDDLARRLNTKPTIVRAHTKLTQSLEILGLDVAYGADDRRYLSNIEVCKRFARFVPDALVKSVLENEYMGDPVLGCYSSVASVLSAIVKRDGNMMSTAFALALDGHSDFVCFDEVKLPFTDFAKDWVEAALEAEVSPHDVTDTADTSDFGFTGDNEIKSCMKDPKRFHTMDQVVFDRRTGTVFLIEQKRGGGPGDAGHTKRTTCYMHAATLCAPAFFASIGITGVENVECVLVDHYGNSAFKGELRVEGGTLDDRFKVRGVDKMLSKVAERLHIATHRGVLPLVNAALNESFRVVGSKPFDEGAERPDDNVVSIAA